MRTGYWVGLFLACAITASAQFVPSSFNYQGVLRGGSGQMLGTGSKTVEFRLWDQAVGGTLKWGRTYAVLLDTNGLFNVELSDSSGTSLGPTNKMASVIAGSPSLYLGLTVQGVGSAEIAPRQQLLSVPFAMMAGDVRSASEEFTVTGMLTAQSGLTVTGLLDAQAGLTVTGPLTAQAGLTTASDIVSGGRVQDKNGDIMPVGTVLPFAGTNAPLGWLLCQGQAVPKDQYPGLYAVIGAMYGSTNASTFMLPDLRGRTVIGEGQGSPTSTSWVQGRLFGEENHKLITEEMPSHKHNIGQTYVGSVAWGLWSDFRLPSGTDDLYQSATQGSDLPHNNMQPILVLKYMIKY